MPETLYLVTGLVQVHRYMADRNPKPEPAMRLVRADSAEEAETKFSRHFSDKSRDYGDSWTVESVEAHATIE